MEPFFFGPDDAPLLGLYHPPETAPATDQGVVICPPMGDEYLRFHRSCRMLAVRLSRAGVPVLRFDFFACGDSAGKTEDGRVSRWMDDVDAALAELARRSTASRFSIVGIRLGAAVASLAAARRGGVDALVLWDPVSAGVAYLEELDRLHRGMLQTAHTRERPQPEGSVGEFLGAPMPRLQRDDIRAIDLTGMAGKPATRALVVQTNDATPTAPLERHLRQLGIEVTAEHEPLTDLWQWQEDFGTSQAPAALLSEVVGWLVRA